MRTETDALGSLELADDALYGINTARALENFALGQHPVRRELMRAVVLVKKAAAMSWRNLAQASLSVAAGAGDGGQQAAGAERAARDATVFNAIVTACDRLLSGEHADALCVEALQGGAGTSTNMNVNEVLANLALANMGERPGRYDLVHPLEDVNRGQSTNDVYPTALRIAAIGELRELSEAAARLQTSLQECENRWDDLEKLGRTELMDAVPVTLGGEFGAYAQAIARDRWRLYKVEERLRQVNLGGTAVGTGAGTSRRWRFEVVECLRQLTGYGLAAAEYPMDLTQNNDVFVEVSGLVKAMAVNLMKIANDLRLMGSGPGGGLGELRLAPMQQGSSIMPGKVNPVICEMTMQCAMRAIANDSAITMAAAHGELELNAFMPLIADSLLESLELLARATELFRTRCVELLEPRPERMREHLERSSAFGLSYAGALGYDAVARVLAHNAPEQARAILDGMLGETRS